VENGWEGGMNNDPCVYHVSFLLNVGDRDEGGGGNRRGDARGTSAQLSRAEPRQRRGEHVMDVIVW
jgi:hypothetical protein